MLPIQKCFKNLNNFLIKIIKKPLERSDSKESGHWHYGSGRKLCNSIQLQLKAQDHWKLESSQIKYNSTQNLNQLETQCMGKLLKKVE